jgi:hypothetical protein
MQQPFGSKLMEATVLLMLYRLHGTTTLAAISMGNKTIRIAWWPSQSLPTLWEEKELPNVKKDLFFL